MNRCFLAGAVFLLACGFLASADNKALKELEGTYKAEAVTKNGKEQPEEIVKGITVKFKGEEMSILVKDKTFATKIKVDAEKTPKTIDISPTDGTEKGKTFLGIYQYDIDTKELVIAFTEKGERPTELKATGETALMKLKKEVK